MVKINLIILKIYSHYNPWCSGHFDLGSRSAILPVARELATERPRNVLLIVIYINVVKINLIILKIYTRYNPWCRGHLDLGSRSAILPVAREVATGRPRNGSERAR